jgi:hypothetical protein
MTRIGPDARPWRLVAPPKHRKGFWFAMWIFSMLTLALGVLAGI